MARTLSEIISGAIGEAEQEIKLASSRDALPVDFDITPDSIVRAAIDEARSVPPALEPEKTASAQPQQPQVKTASRHEVLSDADYAIKLAEALDNASHVVEKLASMVPERAETSTPSPNGLPNMASGHMEPTKDTNTKARTLSAHEAFTGGDSGSGPMVETFKSPHAEGGGKTAAQIEAEVREKQAGMASRLGEAVLDKAVSSGAVDKGVVRRGLDAAQRAGAALGGKSTESAVGRGLMAGGAAAAGAAAAGAGAAAAGRKKHASLASMPAKVAASPADHPGSLPIDPPVSGGVAPDNAGAASMTQRDAKSREKAEIAQHVSEPAFNAAADAGLKDNVQNASAAGAKIASDQELAMRAMLAKIAAKKNDPNATPEDLAKVARLEQALRARAPQTNPSELLG